ncbi:MULTISPECIES: CopG family ribbon-helix-helix protein [Serratia]|uniref:Ribbon-helix-helix protein, CopG family n=1 Tax=Serratia fonticola TaxID=47917 RepID=A0AAP2FFP8_SERFO|nr:MULTISPECIES: CopG family ribbon-helix-helix protein [Serratia]ERK06130.1 Prevent host death protein, Phd antitoxin [Serratia fonticola AU-P3(3)]ERK13676.1 Prevent host death protein, Phd antitoxin [Serratia fonticola AU-AP2C]ALX93688.1 CopG family transcriptional regulator [Serratia fonticola]MBC3214174.1 ribbon-helix-helix protein, CopG family [Serratia fonticola]MBC3252802.1 ribbon-helix-helix protein, CopG family [Serratia fonticola]
MATATSIKIDEELKLRVQQIALARQRTAHWIMREAIREYVEREEKREALRNDALRAWETYQADGKHLTQEEADNWLANLEKGDDTEIPECHN